MRVYIIETHDWLQSYFRVGLFVNEPKSEHIHNFYKGDIICNFEEAKERAIKLIHQSKELYGSENVADAHSYINFGAEELIRNE